MEGRKLSDCVACVRFVDIMMSRLGKDPHTDSQEVTSEDVNAVATAVAEDFLYAQSNGDKPPESTFLGQLVGVVLLHRRWFDVLGT